MEMVGIALAIPFIAMILFGAIIKGESHYYLFGKLLLWEETLIGVGYGLAAALLIWRPLMFVLPGACGILWAWGGAEGTSKNWRRWLIGVIIASVGAMWSPWAIIVALTARLATGLGYGIPCPGDKGSAIGRFWWNRTHNELYADILTRGTIGLILSLSLLPLCR